jgi:metal-dependent amidase/aminoacylase/carboxypeptidase family protein
MQQSKWKEYRKKRHERMISAARGLAINYGVTIPFDLEKATEKEVEDFVKKILKETGGKL